MNADKYIHSNLSVHAQPFVSKVNWSKVQQKPQKVYKTWGLSPNDTQFVSDSAQPLSNVPRSNAYRSYRQGSYLNANHGHDESENTKNHFPELNAWGNKSLKNQKKSSSEHQKAGNRQKQNSKTQQNFKSNKKSLLNEPTVSEATNEEIKASEISSDKQVNYIVNKEESEIMEYHGYEYPEIICNIRETTGGKNTQGNEAIEIYKKSCQENYISNLKVQNNLDESISTTTSSDANESFKTAFSLSFEKFDSHNKKIAEKISTVELDFDRHKNNALLLSLLNKPRNDSNNDDDDNDDDDDEEWADAVSDVFNENTIDDTKVLKLASSLNKEQLDDENLMQQQRISRYLFQSEEDEDVYYHPLKEQIKHDKEWKKERLSRKGIESNFTPRQYYLSIDNDDFDFISSVASN